MNKPQGYILFETLLALSLSASITLGLLALLLHFDKANNQAWQTQIAWQELNTTYELLMAFPNAEAAIIQQQQHQTQTVLPGGQFILSKLNAKQTKIRITWPSHTKESLSALELLMTLPTYTT